MKKIITTLSFVIIGIIVSAQTPQAFKYQAVVRDNAGNVLAGQNVSFRISILDGSAGGPSVFTETHDAVTNEFGLATLEIGNGVPESGVWQDIDWSTGEKFLEVELDPDGGSAYTPMGTTQLLSVPYSLYSETTGDTTRWQKNSNNLYYVEGKVAIGHPSPVVNLDIRSQSPASSSSILLGNSDNSTNLFLSSGHESENPYISFRGMNAFRFMYWDGSSHELMRLTSDGNVGIGTDTQDPVYKLDIRGNDPDDGGIINLGNSDNTHKLAFFSGRENDPNPFILWKEGDPLRFATNEGQYNWSEKMRITSKGNVGIGTDMPDSSALLELNASSKGFLPPRMTQAEIAAISNPANGLQVFNTDDGKMYIYLLADNKWKEVQYGTGTITPGGSSFTCGDALVDSRDGQSYSTVQIGTQCWMAENLNIGTRIDGTIEQSDNGIIEKYCYNDLESNCDIYGGLYQWDEMMQYVTTEGTQGICPDGWHLPTDAEWMTLEEEVESSTSVNWNTTGWRGTDAGGNLKETGTTYWLSPNTGATNSSGFTALPGGYRVTDWSFNDVSGNGLWWSSSPGDSSNPWFRSLYFGSAQVGRDVNFKSFGFSVRCLED